MVYGALGMSHHATEDIAVLRALPDVTVMAPCDRVEARLATQAIYETPGTCYLRLGRGGEKRIHSTEPVFEVGKAIKVKDGNRIAILTTGAIFEESDKARILLEAKGITPAMYTFPTVKPIDVETIKRCCECYDLIVTVEEHNLSGGFGSAVAEVMCELRDRRARLLRIGLEDLYTSVVGSQDHLRDVYGISGTKIAERIMKNV